MLAPAENFRRRHIQGKREPLGDGRPPAYLPAPREIFLNRAAARNQPRERFPDSLDKRILSIPRFGREFRPDKDSKKKSIFLARNLVRILG